ncbi:hypothetical protein HOA91_06260 [Candidatus Woesearchaeota archaeon]|jgi:hypothetical protein|nr:hypothetical protein [Candidatus Woesearchaeota archaeon]
MLGWKEKLNQTEENVSLETIATLQDRKYERLAVYSDIAAAGGFTVALAACDTFPYNIFLGLGLAVSGMSAIMGDKYSNQDSVEVIKKFQPVAGTLAACLATGYYFLGDNQMGTVMAGLSLACYTSTLANILRGKKETDDPQYRGLVGILNKNDPD